MKEIAKRIPNIMNESQYQGTDAYYIFKHRIGETGAPISANIRFISLMDNAYHAIKLSKAEDHIKQKVEKPSTEKSLLPKKKTTPQIDLFAPVNEFNENREMITRHLFDWNEQMKSNKEFHASLWYIKQMLQQADSINDLVLPIPKQEIHLGADRVENLSVMDCAIKIVPHCPLLGEQLIHRLNTHESHLRRNQLIYMLSDEALRTCNPTDSWGYNLPGNKGFEMR